MKIKTVADLDSFVSSLKEMESTSYFENARSRCTKTMSSEEVSAIYDEEKKKVEDRFLPKMIQLSSEAAFLLAADSINYQSLISELDALDAKAGQSVKKLFKGAAMSVVHPLAGVGMAYNASKSFFYLFKLESESLKIEGSRDKIAKRILEYYQVVELAPQKYALKLGERFTESQYQRSGSYNVYYWRPNGVDSNLDFEQLKKLVEPKEKGKS